MAANGASQQAFAPVMSALSTLQSNVDRNQKSTAHEFLEKFQKSQKPEAWTTTFAILQAGDATDQAKIFAATTLKGKITYDLHQLPRDSLPALRDSLLSLLATYSVGPRPLRTQLCVCLANLAIQMTEWKDVLQRVVSSVGTDPEHIGSVLEFLHVLPEEVTEGRKINLSEEELSNRTIELLQDNADTVLQLLIQYSHSSVTASKNPQLLECITSWLKEVPMNDIVNSTLLDTIMNATGSEDSFDAAVECLSAMFRETRDVDECLSTIQTLAPRVIALRPKIAAAAEQEDSEALRGLTRIFAEAGEAWVVLIARMPEQFRELVEALLECAARDAEKDAISQTFIFWYEMKQYLVLEKYIQARVQLADIFSKLVDVMIRHLQFPIPDSGNEKDLFEGDREQEEKFREFRHQMGDVLKDCCEVIGVTECLQKSYDLIEAWVANHGAQTTDGRIPQWQALEAPLFSMRAMGKMVPSDENIMLPRLIPLILQIPDHEKVRFQAIMALGRYTEWTAEHPDTLQPQLEFIMKAFNHDDKEVKRGAALSFKFFCNDCAALLKDYIEQLQNFYDGVLDDLQPASQEEITDGVASVLAQQSAEKVYPLFKLYCDPLVERLTKTAQNATEEKGRRDVADIVGLITIFIQWVQPYVSPAQPNPAVQYCQELFPVLARLTDMFSSSIPILERVCRCWRYMVLSYRTATKPMLPALADKLIAGFTSSRQGCFLWATDSIVREFSEGAEFVDAGDLDAIFKFYENQATTFLHTMSDLSPEDLPDVIEDFFRLTIDVLAFYPLQALSSVLMKDIISAATAALQLLKEEPLMAILHFLRDLLAYGQEAAPTSSFDDNFGGPRKNPIEVQEAVKRLIAEHGELLTQRVMVGMMSTFPGDCFPDASGVLLAMFQLMPQQTNEWVKNIIGMLPAGSVTPQESQRLFENINQRIQANDIRKVRVIMQDFTNSYRRRNVAPREGLGRLEATKFRFTGGR